MAAELGLGRSRGRSRAWYEPLFHGSNSPANELGNRSEPSAVVTFEWAAGRFFPLLGVSQVGFLLVAGVFGDLRAMEVLRFAATARARVSAGPPFELLGTRPRPASPRRSSTETPPGLRDGPLICSRTPACRRRPVAGSRARAA